MINDKLSRRSAQITQTTPPVTTEVLLLAQIRNLEEIIVLQQTALTDITCRFNMLCKTAVAIELSASPEHINAAKQIKPEQLPWKYLII